MKRCIWLSLLALCLLLTACSPFSRPAAPDPPKASAPPAAEDPAPDLSKPGAPQPLLLEQFTMEVVVTWEEADRILAELEELSGLLDKALREKNCIVEEPIRVTISTAGGITAGALAEGGVDAAFLPAVDYIAFEDRAKAVLMTDEEPCTGVAAVTLTREEGFSGLLADALLDTEAGAEFLSLCYPEASYVPVQEQALAAVREQAAE